MEPAYNSILKSIEALRINHHDILLKTSREQIIDYIVRFADEWRNAQSPWRMQAKTIESPFDYKEVFYTLDGLLESLTRDSLKELIAQEITDNCAGYPVIGHVIAGNTPLIAWTSVLRALLVKSASFVKLPSGSASAWGKLFGISWLSIIPELAGCVVMDQWAGGTANQDKQLCDSCDLLLAYGSDDTIKSLKSLRNDRSFIGYGHRVSLSVILPGADIMQCIDGLARDICMYDQSGCLSPHMVYVIGDDDRLSCCISALSKAMDAYLAGNTTNRDIDTAVRINNSRILSTMEGSVVFGNDDLDWTIIQRTCPDFIFSPTHRVVSVASIKTAEEIFSLLLPVKDVLQGCSIGGAYNENDYFVTELKNMGISYICKTGKLQAPPMSWPEDNKPILSSLLKNAI